eukprot:10079808-Alexandrium_andersonii.AAC.1
MPLSALPSLARQRLASPATPPLALWPPRAKCGNKKTRRPSELSAAAKQASPIAASRAQHGRKEHRLSRP